MLQQRESVLGVRSEERERREKGNIEGEVTSCMER